jgi:hypothetical protein
MLRLRRALGAGSVDEEGIVSGVCNSIVTGSAIVGLLVAGCGSGGAATAGAGEDAEAHELSPEEGAMPQDQEPKEPAVVSDEQLAPIPSMPISQLLGKIRADIETLFYPSQPGHAAGWVRYNQHLEVRYDEQRCVELVQLVPGGLTCREAARWVGFGAAMAPIYRAEKCVWPPKSLKHLLGDGVSGELILEGGMFRARLDR